MVVTGPAGTGKTELIRAWCAEQPVVVFHDLADDGPARPPAAAWSRASFPLVLDSVHRASDQQIDDIVRLLARSTGPQLVLVGRWLPSRLRASLPPSDTVEVNGPALALTEKETAQLCGRFGNLSPEMLTEIFAVTGGWVAGTVIAATSMTGDPVGTQHHLHALHTIGETLHDYVVHDVLAHLSDNDLRAVVDTSPVETVCAALFTALTGRRDAAYLLGELARDGMFAVPVGGRGWHRYRRLWRTALYTHVQHFEPDRLRVLHRTASDWYTAQGRYHEGIHHATAAGDHARAAELANRYHFDIAASGAQITTTPAPPPTWTGRPIRPAAPMLAVTSAPTAAHRVTEQAEPAITALHDGRPLDALAHLTTWLCAAQALGPLPHARALRHSAAAQLQLGNLDLAAAQATDARRLLADHGVDGAHDDGWARIVLAEVHIQRHEVAAAAEQLRRLAVDLWHADAPLTAAEHLHRAMIEQQHGDIRAALHTTQQLVQADTATADTLDLHIQLLLANGYRSDAERYATTHSTQLTDTLRRLVSARLLLAQGDPAQATETLQLFIRQPEVSLPHRIDALLLLVAAAIQTGHLEHATHLHRQAHRIAAPARIRRPFLLTETHNLTETRNGPGRRPTSRAAPTPPTTSPQPAAPSAAKLTDSELSVLRLLTSLLTVAEIAEQLHLADNTVKTHVSSIYCKLDVHRRRDAVQVAFKLQLLQPATPGSAARPGTVP